MADIRIRVDADGVVADFAHGVMQRLGLHPDAPDADRNLMWRTISSDPGFWSGLAEMPGARELWAFLKPYGPSILTGVGGNPSACQGGKAAWAMEHLGCRNVVVTGSGRKAEFCRPGDILIDDSATNIAAWEAAGGIGVLHTDTPSTITRLRALGLDGGGAVSPDLADEVERRRADKGFRRDGYTGYVLSSASQSALVEAFGVRDGVSAERYRLVCQHITRQFPAKLDTVDNASPDVVVIGEFLNQATGHHVLAVSVDGEVRRPDGAFFHITHALDDSPAAVDARKVSGGKRPTAGESGKVLKAIVDAAGGDTAVLYNLPPERCCRVDAGFALLDQARIAALPRARQPLVEAVETQDWVFAHGVPDAAGGGMLTAGQKTVRRKGDVETTTYDLLLPGGARKKHAEDGLPAIERRNVRTGEVQFQAFYWNGAQTADPLAGPPAAPPAETPGNS